MHFAEESTIPDPPIEGFRQTCFTSEFPAALQQAHKPNALVNRWSVTGSLG